MPGKTAKTRDGKSALLTKEQKLSDLKGLGKVKNKRSVAYVRGFRRPTTRTILAALEEQNEEKIDGFPPLPAPSHPSDWLAGYLEEG